MSALGKLVVSLALEHAQFTKGLDKSSQEALKFAKNTQDSFDRAQSAVTGSLKNMAAGLSGPFAALLSVNAFAGFVTSSLKAADAINDVAKANEVAVASVLKLSQALSLNGGESDNAGKLFSSLTAKIDEAADGSEKAQAQFKTLNISMTDLARLDGQQLFEKTLQGLAEIEDPIKRNALAMDLLGKSAKGVDIAGLATDYAGNQENFDAAEKSFKEIGEAMDRLDKFSMKASQSMAESFGPVLNGMIKLLDDTVFGFDKLEAQIRKNRNQGATDFKARPTINDKPAFGEFNLPKEFQDGGRREVIDPDAAKRKAAAEKYAKDQIALNKQTQEEKARWEEKFRQENADADRRDYEGQAARREKNDEEAKKKFLETERSKAEFIWQQMDVFYTDKANKTESDYKQIFAKEKELAKERKSFWDSVENTAHTVWTNVWQDGSNAFKNIGKVIKSSILDMLYQITVKKWIIGLSVAGASGTASAATGSSGGSIGGVDFLGTLKTVFADGNASVVDSIGKLGTFLSNGQGGLGDLLGGAIGQYSTQIANVLPYAGAALSLLKGDVKGAILQGAGVAIGSAIGGPIGGAIGGALGSALGGLFGGHVSRPKFYANSTVTQDSVNTFKAYGNSDASGKNVAKAASGGIGEQLQALANSLNTSLKEFTLGVHYSQKYDYFKIAVGENIKKNGTNRDAVFKTKDLEGQQNAIAKSFLVAVQKGFTELPQYLVDIVGRSTFDAKTESVASLGFLGQIKGLKESLATLPPVFDAINYSISKATLKDVDALTSQLNAVQTYTGLFYSEAEQFATYTNQIGAQFGALNLAIPDTRDAFRALVDGIKVVDDASAKQFNSLVALAPAMDTYYTQLQAQADATKQAEEATKALIDTLLETKNFKSLVDFNRAKNYQSLGISLDKIPSYDVGTAYVPNDGLAMIHKGERIIPAAENAKLMAGNGEASSGLLAEVKRLREENQAHAVAQIQAAQRMQKVLEKIDRLGVVLSETDNAGNRVTIDTRVVV